MQIKNSVQLLILSSAFVFTSVALADAVVPRARSQGTCAELLKHCFTTAGLERANCFYQASMMDSCDETPLGKLALKRWSLAPIPTGDVQAQALTGPQLTDQECLKNFDSQWSSSLLQGELSEAETGRLFNHLESCQKEDSIEILRP